MKIFNSIAFDAMYFQFFLLLIFIWALVVTEQPIWILAGVSSVMGLFVTAIRIDEFNSRYKEIITNLDSAKDINYGDKAIKKDGEWL